MGTYRDACNSGRFVISGEVGPPKGTNVERMLHDTTCSRTRSTA
jgi:hypothetical protein